MVLGNRIRNIRVARKVSQSDLAKWTRLKHGYISRVETGHVIPSVEALEKMAHALLIPTYQFFCVLPVNSVDFSAANFAKITAPETDWDLSDQWLQIVNRFRRLPRT